jgi:hypothetical protein
MYLYKYVVIKDIKAGFKRERLGLSPQGLCRTEQNRTYFFETSDSKTSREVSLCF